MNFLKAIILGIVEGITEWLPISSTAHLKIFDSFLKLDVTPEFYEVFEVVIQLGAIVALLIVLWNKIWPFGESKKPLGNGILKYIKKDKFFLWLKIVVACMPAIIYELLLDDVVNFVNESNEMMIIAISLIAVGLVFIAVEIAIKGKEPAITTTREITFMNALVIGLAQLVAAIFPGVSRSGATIIASLLMGISRSAATEFTFELAIPVMLGASFMKIIKYDAAFAFGEIMMLLIACVAAFMVSLFVIRFIISYIKKNSFVPFGIYRIILGIIVILFIA